MMINNEMVKSNEYQEVNVPNPFVMDENENFIAELSTRSTSFCSLSAETPEEKAKLFRVMNNPEKRLADCINMTIYVKDLFCEVVKCKNQETGETITCPRIVVVDKDGVGYQAVSLGVFSAFKKLIAIFGPPTWESPLPIKVMQTTKGARKLLTFDVGFESK